MLGFLTLRPEAFGLDISDLSLKILQLKPQRDGFRLASYGEFPIAEGVVVQGEIKDETQLAKILKESLGKVKGQRLSAPYVVASLPEEKAFLQTIQLPQMPPEAVARAVQFEAENYIPYSLDTVYVDSHIIPPFKNHLEHLDVLLASLSRATVDAYVSVIEKAGLTPKIFEIESMAVTRAVIPGEIAASPVLILDLGATRTGLSIFAGYSLRFSASLATSSQEFTKAIQNSLQVTEERAEHLKQMYGVQTSPDATGRRIWEALLPLLEDLAEQARKYISYYESHSIHQHLNGEGLLIQKIILCGGGANLPGLPEFFTKALKAETVLGNPWVNILPKTSRELPSLSFQESLEYTTALGLALRGARAEKS